MESKWIQDARSVLFHLCGLLLSSPFEIFIDFTKDLFMVNRDEYSSRSKEKFFWDKEVWLILLIALIDSPEALCQKDF